MKDITGILIGTAIVVSMVIASIASIHYIHKNGGKVETIFNTPPKEIFKM